MHSRDVPIVLTRPPRYRRNPTSDWEEAHANLRDAAAEIFAVLGVTSPELVVPPLANQDYWTLWSGSKDGIEYEVRYGEGQHASEFPFWIWVGLAGRAGWSDRLPDEAHSVAAKLIEHGYACMVRGYVSATSEGGL